MIVFKRPTASRIPRFLMAVALACMGLLLAACATVPEGAAPADGEIAQPDRERALQDHAASLLHSWQNGRRDQAQKEWQTFTGLLQPGEEEEDYFLPALDRAAFEEMRAALEPQEGKLPDLSLTPLTAPRGGSSQRQWLRQELTEILHEFGEPQGVDLPDEFVEEVERFTERLTQNDDMGSWYRLAIARMDKYMPSIQGIFAQRGMPESIFYLALVESAFNPDAVSKAGPAGMWQLMPGTGRKYGLTTSRKADQRKDPVKSSLAARDYLHDLLMNLGDSQSMLLAIAAYNTGEGRIQSLLDTLEEGNNRNFWSLFNKGLLPKTTNTLIAKLLAAAVIGHNRERFGVAPGTMPEVTARMVLYRPVSISYLLAVGQWEREELDRLNPGLEEETTIHPEASGFELALPRRVAKRMQKDAFLSSAMTPPLAGTPSP